MNNILKIVNCNFEMPIVFNEDKIQLLIIENPHEFYKIVSMLILQFDGGEGDFVFVKGEKQLKLEYIGCILDNIFNFDLNDKKVLNLLYKQLDRQAQEKDYFIDLDNINLKINDYLDKIFSEFSFLLSANELCSADIFKAVGVRFEKVYDSLLEKIICYINIMVELKQCELFIFVNLKSVLSDDELAELYKHCFNEKIHILLIESSKLRPLIKYEQAKILTEDFCEILENYL